MTLRSESTTSIVIAAILSLTYVGSMVVACAVTPAQHAANAAESAQAAAEYTQCREQAKADGGWPAYQSCACGVDRKHGVDAGVGCP